MLAQNHRLSRSEIFWLIIIGVIVVPGLYVGWRLLWFLTDDAYIAFRYISNSVKGLGYVWNPPPFKPVEGYTSFLWVVLLDGVWRVTGVAPPEAANWLALTFAYCSLVVTALLILQVPWKHHLIQYRLFFLAVALIGIISNRTFLTWSSSGLETAMFNFLVLLWIWSCLKPNQYQPSWIFRLSTVTLLITLTRPDGMLFTAATITIVAFIIVRSYLMHRPVWQLLGAATPILGVPLHSIWRFSMYGELLPNTYYAKAIQGRIMFESGYRYFLSFVIEYMLWVWLLILFIGVLYWLRDGISKRRDKFLRIGLIERDFATGIMLLTLMAHIAYYTIFIGGDHFEYRV